MTPVNPSLCLSDFDYDLPESLIAQYPAQERTQSRLLLIDESRADFQDKIFKDIIQYLQPNDLLVFNNTKVIKARLHGRKPTGGKIEVLVERMLTTHKAMAHVKASKAPKAGTQLFFDDTVYATVTGRDDSLFELVFEQPVLDVLDTYGHVPLPPYIAHEDRAEDVSRYQTVYAQTAGAVAAPTAGLHFDQDLMKTLSDRGVQQAFVTLHVGAGTFQPVRVDHIKDHVMHAEWYDVPPETVAAIQCCREAGGRVFAVGTTSVRSLESAAIQAGLLDKGCPNSHQGDTRLFITPGYEFQVVDGLLTNFHLPQSTLLMLVSALIGLDCMKQAYQHAIREEYRFFSYGDAMLILPETKGTQS
ncbi:MAG: tRNA preQ1(34) S-adenosylmethionine ribosyltransferase-isomerase QueA [Alcaligenaceae bacterium]|nr:tRNA preQ1(34) S-adenosylmethionine ribosyltransferase-isomerase QueA [Alcaligenaceae bacterium]